MPGVVGARGPAEGSVAEGAGRLSRRAALRLAGGSVLGLAVAPLLAACTVAPGGGSAGSSDPPRRKNLLVITADDMRIDELALLPNLSALAAAGTTFTNFRVPTPMCNPTRAMFLTGQRANGPNGHGITSQSIGLSSTQRQELLPRWLARSGYGTALVGKYLTAPKRPRFEEGWYHLRTADGDDPAQVLGYSVWDGTATTGPELEQRQEQRWADEVDAYLTAAPGPWFCWYASGSPHLPLQPTPEEVLAFADVQWPYVPEDVSAKPTWVRSRPEPAMVDALWMQAKQRLRLAELAELDAIVGRLWTHLEETGQLEDTIVAFWSDNGVSLLEHRMSTLGKNTPYDVCARVPLVVAGGGVPAGETVDVVTYGPDLTATALHLAGARAGIPQDGVSLLDVYLDQDAFADRAILGHCASAFGALPEAPPCDWVVTADRKLIRYQEPAGGFVEATDRFELYDLDTDPGELVNVAWDPARQSERDALEARLDALLAGAA